MRLHYFLSKSMIKFLDLVKKWKMKMLTEGYSF